MARRDLVFRPAMKAGLKPSFDYDSRKGFAPCERDSLGLGGRTGEQGNGSSVPPLRRVAKDLFSHALDVIYLLSITIHQAQTS